MARKLSLFLSTLLFLLCALGISAAAATKVTFPYTPIGVASLPWWIAKEARLFEKYGLDVAGDLNPL